MALTVRIPEDLDGESERQPLQVRMALRETILALVDSHAHPRLQFGQLEFDLRDENDFSTTYINPGADWIPGHFYYRWNQDELILRHVEWPVEYPRA